MRATPAVVWALCLLQWLLATWFAVAVPALHAPDEHAHVDLVRTEDLLGIESYADAELSEQTLAALPLVDLVGIDWRVASVIPPEGLPSGQARPRTERPTFDALASARDSGVLNNVSNHPPLYYLYERAALLLAPDGWSWDRVIGFLRLASSLLVVPVPWLAHWSAVRVGGSRRTGVTAAAFVLAIPQLAYLAGTVNNDDMLVLLGAATTLAAVWIATGDHSLRTALLAGLAAGLAMLTKVFGIGTVVVVAAAYGVGWWRHRRTGVSARALALAGATALLAGGWWVVRQLVVHGTPAPRQFAYPTAAPGNDLGYWLSEFVSRLSRTFWGFFGVEQFPLPSWLVAVLTAALAALLVSALLRGRWAAPGARTADLVILLLPLATTLAMIVYAAWQGYVRSGLPVGLHGRYLFIGAAGLAAALALGSEGATRSRWWPLAVVVTALAVQGVAGWTVVRSFWAGSGLLDEVRTLLAWAPWRARYVVASWGLLAATATAVLALVTIGPVARSRGTPARQRSPRDA